MMTFPGAGEFALPPHQINFGCARQLALEPGVRSRRGPSPRRLAGV